MRSLVVIGVLAGLVLILLAGGCNNYNKFVGMEEDVENAWSKVQSAYQERADLVPNLVATVKGAADFERGTLEAVTNARAKATSVQVDPTNLTPEKLAEFQKAQSELGQSIGRLLVSVESYPTLQANASFRDLQAQLEGMENRIRVERNRYNDASAAYNKSIRRFPASFFASIFGFSQKAQFEAQEGSQNAPKVAF
jgi:LemA protein